jgi:hypothetical protein
MPFQVVELKLDAEDKVIDRKAIPYPYPQRLDAVETIEKLITRLQIRSRARLLVGDRERRKNADQIHHRRRLSRRSLVCGLVRLELLAKLCAKDFAVNVAGKFGNEDEFARSLVWGKAGTAVSQEHRFSEIAVSNHKGCDFLALRQFYESDRSHVLYSAAFPNYDFDLGRVHISSPPND